MKRQYSLERDAAGRSNSTCPPRTESLRLLHLALGLILFVAGTIKLYELGTKVQTENYEILLLLVFSEAECLGGLCLVGGVYSAKQHDLALATFTGLATASLLQVAAGKCSSGYFGTMIINPWFMLILDIAVVTTLCWTRPQSASSRPSLFDLITLGAIAIAVTAGGWFEARLVSVGGRVMKGSEPLRSASITLTGSSDTVRIFTDADGYFYLSYIHPGRYAASSDDGSWVAAHTREPIVKSLRNGIPSRFKQQVVGKVSVTTSKSLVWIEVKVCSDSNTLIEF